MDPNIQVPYADSWTVGLQRAVGRNMALEVRYVGTRSRDLWETLNYNEINIFDNGFINEFKAAQANLQANVAAGLAAQGFAYRGPDTGTVPLPTMFAYFQGSGDPNNAAAYTSANFRSNNTFLTPLARFNPNPFSVRAKPVRGRRTTQQCARHPVVFRRTSSSRTRIFSAR